MLTDVCPSEAHVHSSIVDITQSKRLVDGMLCLAMQAQMILQLSCKNGAKVSQNMPPARYEQYLPSEEQVRGE